MTISFYEFIQRLFSSPVLFVTVLLSLGVIFVNGWTDAPNAIATCVSTRAIKPKSAIIMAAVCNFAGVLFMSLVNVMVAETVMRMVNFDGAVGGTAHGATYALCAALFAIIIWSVTAWYFGIPTSESHALIAGLTGAAIALKGSFAGVNGSEWIKVIYGLALSTFLGFFTGYITVGGVKALCRRMDRRRTNRFFKGAQVFGGGFMAFMHGAQDGQKFMAVLLLGIALSKGTVPGGDVSMPFWLMVTCSAVMALGTSAGGYRIIKSVGMDMVKLEQYQGFSADIAAAFCLLISSVLGIPVSTTHTKTTAIMGVGANKRLSAVNWNIVRDMVLTWVLVFPGCGLIGYLMARLFIWVF